MDDDFQPDIEDDFEPDPPKLQGKIEKSEGMLQRVINASLTGPSGFSGPESARAEEALPMAAQIGTDYSFNITPQGRAAGVIPGVKYGATVAATTAGEGLKQGVKQLRGEPFDYGKVAETGLTTAGVEGLFRGANQALFKSQIGKEVVGGAKKTLSDVISRLDDVIESNPGLKVAKYDVIGFLDQVMQKVHPVGAQASALKRMRSHILSKKVPNTLSASEVSNLKNAFSDIAEFRPDRAGVIKNKAADVTAKETSSYLGGLLEGMGEYGGVPVKEAMSGSSRAYKHYPTKKKGIKDVIKNVLIPASVGGAYGFKEKDPVGGLMAAVGTSALGSNTLRNLLYNVLVKSGASKAGRVGISEIIRNRDQ